MKQQGGKAYGKLELFCIEAAWHDAQSSAGIGLHNKMRVANNLARAKAREG